MNRRVMAAIGGGVATLLAFVATAFFVNGLFAAIAFVFALGFGAAIPLAGVTIMKDGFPLGNLLAKWLAIGAQFTYGKGALVRREDGGYEWHRLDETADGYRVELDDGTELDVDGDRGDLYRFGGRPLAILEEKGANVEQFTVQETPPEAADESTREVRAGIGVHHAEQLRDDHFLVSLKQLAAPASGSAGPHLAQRGREKALEEAGGQQAISGFWLTIFAGLLTVGGFVLGYGALIL